MEVEGGARYKGQWRGNMRLGYLGSGLACFDVRVSCVLSLVSELGIICILLADGNQRWQWKIMPDMREQFSMNYHSNLHSFRGFHGIFP